MARLTPAEGLARRQTAWRGVSIILEEDATYYYDHEAAERAVEFFSVHLTHFEGEFAGRPFHLADWQSDLVVRPLFGWKRRADGLRRFRKLFLAIPKKNGKTALSAGLGLYLLYCDHEPGAEIICAAADRDQAALVFKAAKASVETNATLSRQSRIYRRAIDYVAERASFRVVSSDVRSQHGPNIHGILIDELHAQPDRELFDTLTKGVAARRQPLQILITTAGDDTESLCFEEWQYATKVIAGMYQDDTVLPVVFAADPKDDWRDEATWQKANPNLGCSPKLDYFRAEAVAAANEPRKLNAFKRLHLNIWTQATTVWIPRERWEACAAADFAAPAVGPGMAVAAGMDLSSKLDLTAVVVAIRRRDAVTPPLILEVTDEAARQARDAEASAPVTPPKKTLSINWRLELHPFFWMPEETLAQRSKEDRVPFTLWREQGYLRTTPGPVVDYDRIFEDLTTEIGPSFALKDGQIGYDPHNATQMATHLNDAGYTCVEVLQRVLYLSEPAKLLEALVMSQRLAHAPNPVLDWCRENTAVREDKNGNIFPFKVSRRQRIDGIVATVIALACLLKMPDGPALSPYSPTRGVQVIRW